MVPDKMEVGAKLDIMFGRQNDTSSKIRQNGNTGKIRQKGLSDKMVLRGIKDKMVLNILIGSQIKCYRKWQHNLAFIRDGCSQQSLQQPFKLFTMQLGYF